MMSGDLAGKIKGAVFALIAGIIILYLVPVNFAAADALNRQFHDHCRIGAESIRAVQLTAVAGITTLSPEQMRVFEVTQTGTTGSCQFTFPVITSGYSGATAISIDDTTPAQTTIAFPTGFLTFTTDSGSQFTLTPKTSPAGAKPTGGNLSDDPARGVLGLAISGSAATRALVAATLDLGNALDNQVFAIANTAPATNTTTTQAVDDGWLKPGRVMSQFIGVNRLITSILPVLITIGLFTVVGFGAMKLWKGEGMASAIAAEVGTVILVVIVMNLAPSMFDAISEGATANAGQYGVTAQFGGITDLLFGLLPLLVVLSLIGLLAWRGYSGYKAMTGGNKVAEVTG